MSEPTIDEMLAWLDQVKGYDNDVESSAIRAILEQHRDGGLLIHHSVRETNYRQIGLQAIRAFVERVKNRVAEMDHENWPHAIVEELAAMEAGAEERVTK